MYAYTTDFRALDFKQITIITLPANRYVGYQNSQIYKKYWFGLSKTKVDNQLTKNNSYQLTIQKKSNGSRTVML